MKPSDSAQVLALLAYWNIAPTAPSREIPLPERTEIIIENAHVALDGDQVVGVCSYIRQTPILAEGASFGVAPAYHCRGIGEKLVLASLRERYARGIRKVRSEADRPETIRWLVERFGYRVVGKASKRHAFGAPEVEYWTVLELELDSLPELRAMGSE